MVKKAKGIRAANRRNPYQGTRENSGQADFESLSRFPIFCNRMFTRPLPDGKAYGEADLSQRVMLNAYRRRRVCFVNVESVDRIIRHAQGQHHGSARDKTLGATYLSGPRAGKNREQ
jgi:hypothetical protein